MILIVPLGSSGSTFHQQGYSFPKVLVNVHGTPILYYLFRHIQLDLFSLIIVPYHRAYVTFRIEDQLRKEFPKANFYFVPLHFETRGPAHTICTALKSYREIFDLSTTEPVLCCDGDNVFPKFDILCDWVRLGGPPCVYCVNDGAGAVASPPVISRYSHVTTKRVDGVEELTGIKEKVRVSNFACVGVYGFSSILNIIDATESFLKASKNSSIYISGVLNATMEMQRQQGSPYTVKIIDEDNYISLGDPLEVRLYANSLSESIYKLRVCFDLDNTLVTFPKVHGDYSTVEPIPQTVALVRRLKELGHTIIIHTARRMGTHKHNAGAALRDIGIVTFDTLEKFKIPYDEIYFGKPLADFYIDDKGLSAFSDLNKEVGIYNDTIAPRSFHSVDLDDNTLVRKSSSKPRGLCGEIFFYKNIPHGIRDLFPALVDHNSDETSMTLEKIHGASASHMLVSSSITSEMLTSLILALRRIHTHSIDKESQECIVARRNLYSNYATKLKERLNASRGAYEKLPNAVEKTEYIIQRLEEYERKDAGDMAIIHGDPVFTNVFFTNSGGIRMIDVRGKLGSECSIYGDVMYDWAKVFQSLIGYDEILSEGFRVLKEDYRAGLIKIFMNSFERSLSPGRVKDLFLVTSGLVLSLIPLHADANHFKLYQIYTSVLEAKVNE